MNLTRFNLSLPEKREFFLESRGIFSFGGGGGGGGGGAPALFSVAGSDWIAVGKSRSSRAVA